MRYLVQIDDYDRCHEFECTTKEEAMARWDRSSADGDYSCEVWDMSNDPPRSIARFEKD
jgi:hypothetical protein